MTDVGIVALESFSSDLDNMNYGIALLFTHYKKPTVELIPVDYWVSENYIHNKKLNDCVYLLWYNEKVIYVGYTSNLRRRLKEHIFTHKRTFDLFQYTVCNDKKTALDLEKRLQEKLNLI